MCPRATSLLGPDGESAAFAGAAEGPIDSPPTAVISLSMSSSDALISKFTCGCSMSGTLSVPLMSEAFARSATNCASSLPPASCNWPTPAAERERHAGKFRIRLPVMQGHWTDDEVVHRHVDSLDVRRRFDLASNDGFQRHFRAGQQQGVDSIERHAGGRLV